MSHTSSNNPYTPPQWSSDYFRDAASSAPGAVSHRGMIGHVPIIAVLLIVQGALEIVFSLLGFMFIAMVQFIPNRDLTAMRPLGIMMAFLSVPAAICGVLRIIAGWSNLHFRRRVLGMTALGVGLLTMITAYCAPTSIALAVYGLIVYLNEPVIAAFALGDRGHTVSEIKNAFP